MRPPHGSRPVPSTRRVDTPAGHISISASSTPGPRHRWRSITADSNRAPLGSGTLGPRPQRPARNACVRRFVRISRRWRSRRPEASGIALAVSSTLVLIMASSSDSSMASSNCMISPDTASRLFPIAVSCSATENRTRHGSCPLSGSPNHKARRNSVLICGERPNGMWVIYGTSEFQSTLPLRGATATASTSGMPSEFQSTFPLRGATIRQEIRLDDLAISIHVPLAGSDSSTKASRNRSTYFNPRSPLRGSDSARCGTPTRRGDFNPHSPCGE